MSEMFHSVESVAKRLDLHPKTVLRCIRDGRLRATRIGKSWRILESDLDAFAGVRSAPTTASPARVTAIADLPGISMETARRLATALQALAVSHPAGSSPQQLETAYDPERSHLKVVAIGAIADVATLLHSLNAFAEAFK